MESFVTQGNSLLITLLVKATRALKCLYTFGEKKVVPSNALVEFVECKHGGLNYLVTFNRHGLLSWMKNRLFSLTILPSVGGVALEDIADSDKDDAA